jgi:hypothetical protein
VASSQRAGGHGVSDGAHRGRSQCVCAGVSKLVEQAGCACQGWPGLPLAQPAHPLPVALLPLELPCRCPALPACCPALLPALQHHAAYDSLLLPGSSQCHP